MPLNPNDESLLKYKLVDMSAVKRYKSYPAVIKITSEKKVTYVLELLNKIFEDNQVENKQLNIKDEKIKIKTKNALIKEGLIKTK